MTAGADDGTHDGTDAVPAAAEPRGAVPMAATPPGARLPLLVVEDEPHIGRIIRTRLEQGPFDVTVAEHAEAAFAALEARPDTRLLVLDLMLPGMSGLDILRRLRADARFAALPCLVLTAAGHDAPFHDADALGVADFMTKPFSPRRLFARVLTLTGVVTQADDAGPGTSEAGA